MTVNFEGKTWTVTKSSEENPNISIKETSGNKTRHLVWRESDFTIVRPNTDNDFDMRGRGSGTVVITAAKDKALDMMKAYIRAHGDVKSTQQRSLNEITVGSFNSDNVLDPNNGQDAQWSYDWAQGTTRAWHLVIDMDRPLETSSQDPHVGWTLSATSTKRGNEVRNVFGHVWVDDVPASRQG